jgi:Ser/Thr protein kinase RdoA (MazF antagonist)
MGDLRMDMPPIGLWGVEAPLAPLAGGHRNRAFRTAGLERDVVFKTTRRLPEAIEWLAPVFGIAEGSGFAVPWAIKSRTGRYVEHGWTCEIFIQGRAFRDAEMRHVRAPMLRFHAATKAVAQRPGFLAAGDFIHCDVGGDVDLRGMPADIVAACRAAWSRIAERPVCAVHGDLNPGNLLWTADGKIALLDWDECRVDAALFDGAAIGWDRDEERLAVLAWEVACSWHLEPAYARHLAAKLPLSPPG